MKRVKKNLLSKRNSIKRVSAHLCTVLLVFFVVSAKAEMLSVKADNVNLRSGPGKSYGVKWEYDAGFPVEIVKRKGNWLMVKDFEGDTGWLHTSLLIDRPHMIVKANGNKDETINIRNGPGLENKIVGKAYYGVVFETLHHHQSGWVEVKHESGLTGWIKSTLLWGF